MALRVGLSVVLATAAFAEYWNATAIGLLEKIGEPARPALERRLAKVSKVQRVDHGDGAWTQMREEAHEVEEKRIKDSIRRIRAK